jgi:hypothetical protein
VRTRDPDPIPAAVDASQCSLGSLGETPHFLRRRGRWLGPVLGPETEGAHAQQGTSESIKSQPIYPDDHVAAAINAGLELRRHGRYIDPNHRTGLREFAGL